jgi:hypothetical protein
MLVIQQQAKVRFLLRSRNESFKQLNGPEMNHLTVWMVLNESFSLRPAHRNHNIEVVHVGKMEYVDPIVIFLVRFDLSEARVFLTAESVRHVANSILHVHCTYISLRWKVEVFVLSIRTTVHKHNSTAGTRVDFLEPPGSCTVCSSTVFVCPGSEDSSAWSCESSWELWVLLC